MRIASSALPSPARRRRHSLREHRSPTTSRSRSRPTRRSPHSPTQQRSRPRRSRTRTPANDGATDTDTVTTSADLSMLKTDSRDPVSPGEVFDYTMTVTNTGPSDAANLQVTDTIPQSGFFLITGIVASAGTCSHVVNDVTCTLATLPAGGTWVITVSLFLDPFTPGGLDTDTALVTSTTTDPVPGNDSDSESTIVLPAADMIVTKTDGTSLDRRRHLDDVHDHADEQRPVDRAARPRPLGPDPGRDHRLGVGARLHDRAVGSSRAPRPLRSRRSRRSCTS